MRSRVLIPVAFFFFLVVTPLAAQGPLDGQTAADRHKAGHSKLGEAFDEGPRERPAKIDGIGRTSFPITTWRQVESEAGGHIIAYVGDEAPWQLGAVFTSPKTIAERRPLVEKFLVGYRRGAAAYNLAFGKRENGKLVPGPNYDEMIALLSTALKQPPERVAQGLPFIDPEGRLDVGDIYKQVAFWQASGAGLLAMSKFL